MSIFLQFKKKNISFSTICLVNVPDISCVFFSPSIPNTHFSFFPLAKPYVTMLVILSKLLSGAERVKARELGFNHPEKFTSDSPALTLR